MTGFQLPQDLSELLEREPEPKPGKQLAYTCGGCPETWPLSSKNACHCGACHRTFSGETLFDRHRVATGPHGSCLDPATMRDESGKPLAEFRRGMWRGPEAPEGTWDKFGAKDEPGSAFVIPKELG